MNLRSQNVLNLRSSAVPSILSRYREDIDIELRAILGCHPESMYDMLRYQLGWIDADGKPNDELSGKALRPTLCLLSSEAISGEHKLALPAAAAIELVHNFSLIHDDVQDDDAVRRNRPSVWAIWGKPQAINAGTAMRILANITMLRLVERGISYQKICEAQRLLDRCSLKLIEGQYLDIEFESRLSVSVDEYINMASGKTAALFACAMETGALLATESMLEREAFKKFGYLLGLSFQIRDDILGIWGNEKNTGKSSKSDLWRRKKSFPIVYALEKADTKSKVELEGYFRHGEIDEKGYEKVKSILEFVKAEEHSQQMVDQLCDEALTEIDGLPLASWADSAFDELVGFLTHREY